MARDRLQPLVDQGQAGLHMARFLGGLGQLHATFGYLFQPREGLGLPRHHGQEHAIGLEGIVPGRGGEAPRLELSLRPLEPLGDEAAVLFAQRALIFGDRVLQGVEPVALGVDPESLVDERQTALQVAGLPSALRILGQPLADPRQAFPRLAIIPIE